MKKIMAFVLTALLLGSVFSAPAFAGSDELIKVLMTSPGVTVAQDAKDVSEADLGDAIEKGKELIGRGCKLDPERITLLQTGSVACEREVNYVSFKVWSTLNRTVGLFFRAEESEDWELISCNLGDVIEGRFEASGSYAIVVGW